MKIRRFLALFCILTVLCMNTITVAPSLADSADDENATAQVQAELVSNKKKKGKVYFLVKTNTEKKDMNGEVETKADRLGFYDAKKWLSQRSVESPLAKEIFFDHQAV